MQHVFDSTTPFFGVEHPPIFSIIWKWIKNTYAAKAERKPENYVRWHKLRNASQELVIAWMLRLKQIHVKPPAIIRLSMMLRFFQCPVQIWNILSHLRLVLSINSTDKLYTIATSIPISVRQNWTDHETIAVVGADNMSYITHKSNIRVENNAAVAMTVLNTINTWQIRHEPDLFPTFGQYDYLFEVITPNMEPIRIADVTLTSADLTTTTNLAWNHTLNLLEENHSHVERPPPTDETAPPHIEFNVPLFDLTTSAYIDMEVFLNHVYLKYLGRF